jgi:hypothetical protein
VCRVCCVLCAQPKGGDGGIEIKQIAFSSGFSRESIVANFTDQLHNNIPIYMVHLNDDEERVRTAALGGFRQIAELIGGDFVKLMDDTKRIDNGSYDDFIVRIAPLLTAKCADRLRGYTDAAVGYFASNWQGIRGNAVILAGKHGTPSPPPPSDTAPNALPSALTCVVRCVMCSEFVGVDGHERPREILRPVSHSECRSYDVTGKSGSPLAHCQSPVSAPQHLTMQRAAAPQPSGCPSDSCALRVGGPIQWFGSEPARGTA